RWHRTAPPPTSSPQQWAPCFIGAGFPRSPSTTGSSKRSSTPLWRPQSARDTDSPIDEFGRRQLQNISRHSPRRMVLSLESRTDQDGASSQLTVGTRAGVGL